MTDRRPRIVSLLPSVTETLRSWGADPIACTRFCEQPDLLHVGGTKDPDIAAIVALDPDVVILDTEENRLEDARALEDAGLAVHVTAVRRVEDVGPTLTALADGIGEGFDEVSFDAAIADAVVARAAAEAVPVFVPIWRRPWMTISGDTYGSSLLAALGFLNVFLAHEDRYPTIDLEEATNAGAQIVVAPSEPYPFAPRHETELRSVAPVVFVDGQDLFWWGVRTPDALVRLAAALGTR